MATLKANGTELARLSFERDVPRDAFYHVEISFGNRGWALYKSRVVEYGPSDPFTGEQPVYKRPWRRYFRWDGKPSQGQVGNFNVGEHASLGQALAAAKAAVRHHYCTDGGFTEVTYG